MLAVVHAAGVFFIRKSAFLKISSILLAVVHAAGAFFLGKKAVPEILIMAHLRNQRFCVVLRCRPGPNGLRPRPNSMRSFLIRGRIRNEQRPIGPIIVSEKLFFEDIKLCARCGACRRRFFFLEKVPF